MISFIMWIVYSNIDNATGIHFVELLCYEPLPIMTHLMSEHIETSQRMLSLSIIHTANIFFNIDIAANKYLENLPKKVRYITMSC